MCIATDGEKNLPISAQDVCFNSNLNGCNGGQITTPWTYIRWRGAVSGGQYNSLLYILLKGSLQVTMAAGFADGACGNEPLGAVRTWGRVECRVLVDVATDTPSYHIDTYHLTRDPDRPPALVAAFGWTGDGNCLFKKSAD